MRKLYLFLLFIAITSCSPKAYFVKMNRRVDTNVELNSSLKREIGESLITKSDMEYQKALRITELPTFSISTLRYPYQAGTVLPYTAFNKDYDFYYLPEHLERSYTAFQGDIYTNDKVFGVAVSRTDPEKIVPFVMSNTNSLGGFFTRRIDGFNTEPVEYINGDCDRCFKKEFIYNGKSGNNLKFIYREYVNDLARPAFTQELQYDLADGNMIGFKGLRLEVKEATNTVIHYKVLQDFE